MYRRCPAVHRPRLGCPGRWAGLDRAGFVRLSSPSAIRANRSAGLAVVSERPATGRLTAEGATIETSDHCRLSYCRTPFETGQVPVWELETLTRDPHDWRSMG